MSPVQAVSAALIVVLTGDGALYKADDRDPDRETEVGGVPVRFLSLMIVSFGSVLLLALVFNAPRIFFTALEVPRDQWWSATAKAVAIGAIFAVVGAATADSVF